MTWKYYELETACLAYADRYDIDVDRSLRWMVPLAESRMSRIMRQREMSVDYLITIDGSEAYDLPSDFAGLRDINIDGKASLHYLNPEQMNNQRNYVGGKTYYSIIGNKLHIVPTLNGDGSIKLYYYQRLSPVYNWEDPAYKGNTNWLLQTHPDIYRLAVCAEIEEFVKNDVRADMMRNQLYRMFAEMHTSDWKDRWSGNSLATRLETNRGT